MLFLLKIVGRFGKYQLTRVRTRVIIYMKIRTDRPPGRKGNSMMTASERSIRFNLALEMVQRIYDDYCRDQNKTREQTYEFCCLVREMTVFADKLVKEADHE